MISDFLLVISVPYLVDDLPSSLTSWFLDFLSQLLSFTNCCVVKPQTHTVQYVARNYHVVIGEFEM